MKKRILVYICDYDKDGTPIFAVAGKLEEIPIGCDGPVGEYQLIRKSTLTVTRVLVPA